VKATTVGKNGRVTSRRPNKRQVESLIAAGAFDHLGTRNQIIAEYYRLRDDEKKDGAPPEYTDDKWVELEKEAIGLCLSREPLYKRHELLILRKKWTPIHDIDGKKKAHVFGQVESITPHTSKAGNSMFIVTLGDGLDTMKFFVFKGAMEFFRDNVKVGKVGAFPLDKFDESDTRFFDDRRDMEIIGAE
jgi:DNA polymerase III alpha subunit